TRGHAEFYNVPMTAIRRAAVAGSWYPGRASALASAVDGHLENATSNVNGDLVALVAPHAGLKYSGLVAAHAYRLLRGRRFDVVVLVGPSHFVAFDGVAVVRAGGFETPFGVAQIDADTADAIAAATPIVREQAVAHQPGHACGGGPTVAVMRAAKALGARDAVVLNYADSGDVSGDKSAVVGYLAAAFGNFASETLHHRGHGGHGG